MGIKYAVPQLYHNGKECCFCKEYMQLSKFLEGKCPNNPVDNKHYVGECEASNCKRHRRTNSKICSECKRVVCFKCYREGKFCKTCYKIKLSNIQINQGPTNVWDASSSTASKEIVDAFDPPSFINSKMLDSDDIILEKEEGPDEEVKK